MGRFAEAIQAAFNREVNVPRLAEKGIAAVATIALGVAIGVGVSIAASDPTPAIWWFTGAAICAVIAVFFVDDMKSVQRWKRISLMVFVGLVAVYSVWRADRWVVGKVIVATLASEKQSALDTLSEVARIRTAHPPSKADTPKRSPRPDRAVISAQNTWLVVNKEKRRIDLAVILANSSNHSVSVRISGITSANGQVIQGQDMTVREVGFAPHGTNSFLAKIEIDRDDVFSEMLAGRVIAQIQLTAKYRPLPNEADVTYTFKGQIDVPNNTIRLEQSGWK